MVIMLAWAFETAFVLTQYLLLFRDMHPCHSVLKWRSSEVESLPHS